jgi:hypothetical protein
MGKFHPSRRSYATSISNKQTNLEQLGGNSKAGLGFNIGVQNSLNQHIKQRAPTLSGSNMIVSKQKGLVNSVYEINTSNQLNNIKTVKYGMTRSPADGVNKIEREFDQKYTDYWLAAQHLNRNISIIRGILPTNCCLPLSFSEKQLEDVLNKKIVDNFNFNLGNDLDNNLGNDLDNNLGNDLDNNLGNDLDNNLGNESQTFLDYFQQAVGGLLSDSDSYWQTTDPNSSESFLIRDDVGLPTTEKGIFVRYILDGETKDFVPASFVSNRSPVPQKVYVLNGGQNSLRPKNDNSDPVVLLIKIANLNKARELLPSTKDGATYMAGYPHDSNSMDMHGRAWWPNTGQFGQGLHKSFSDTNWFDICQTPGAWFKTQTQLSDGRTFVRSVISTQSQYCDQGFNKTEDGGGGLNESFINSSLFQPGKNTGTEENTYLDVYNLYKFFIDNTYGLPDNKAGILSNVKNRANIIYDGDPTQPISLIFNDILDGMLPSVLAINEDCGPNLDIRVMLSKLLTFNTLLWNNFPFDYSDYHHWGWNEIPVRNDNTLWKSTSSPNVYNLLVYIPIWNEILTEENPWDILPNSSASKKLWFNLSNQLEKYVDELKDNDIHYINFVFATDEKYTGSVAYLKNEVLNNRDPYQITGFTSLGFPSKNPPKNFTFTTPTYTFTYYKDNITDSGDVLILGDSFVWKNN